MFSYYKLHELLCFHTIVLNWVLSESAWPPERLDCTCYGNNCSISECGN